MKLSISWSWPHIADRLYITVSYMSFNGFWKNSNFRSKSIGVSLWFLRKTNQNSVFLSRCPHIVDCLYITVPYMNFYRFWKSSNFHSKSKGVSLRFTENRQFRAKTDRNSVFLGRCPHIVNRLYIMVPYMSFYRFWTNSNFRSKSVGVSLRF
jgi:hypothetical protein